jgi:large subunit ribosomal protein L23
MIKDPHSVIQTIRLTEKATRLGEENNEYVFIVDPKANKIQIKAAVEKHFGKKVAGVRTCNTDGKARRERRADYGRTNHYKKAIVRLKDGERLDLV